MRRLIYAVFAIAIAFGMRAPAALAFSPELSLDYWWSRIAREDQAGSDITRTSRALPHVMAQLDLDLTSRLGLNAEMVAPAAQLVETAAEITDGTGALPSLGYHLDATYRLPIIGAGVGPTYVHSVLAPHADDPVTEVAGLGGVAEGSLSLSDRVQLGGTLRYLPEAQVREAGQEQKGSYTGYEVGASLEVLAGLEARAAYRQERAVVSNPMPGVQERAYQQSGYALGLGYRF